jgi:energy-coupling factor transporter ATP-binding protein EcfA2
VIILLNGPFGVGKTTTARHLRRLLPAGSVLYDPELLGLACHLLPRRRRPEDFQDLRAWRRLTVRVGRLLARAAPGDVVLPVSLGRPDHFAEIAGGLGAVAFRLTASETTLRARILGDLRERGAQRWRLDHLPQGLALCADDRLGEAIPTDGRSPAEVAEAVLASGSLRPRHPRRAGSRPARARRATRG